MWHFFRPCQNYIQGQQWSVHTSPYPKKKLIFWCTYFLCCWRMLPQRALCITQKPVWVLAAEMIDFLSFCHCNVPHCQQLHKNCSKYIPALPGIRYKPFYSLLPQHHLSPVHSHRILLQTVYWKTTHPPAGIPFQNDKAGIVLAGVSSASQPSVGESDSLLGSSGALKVWLYYKEQETDWICNAFKIQRNPDNAMELLKPATLGN